MNRTTLLILFLECNLEEKILIKGGYLIYLE